MITFDEILEIKKYFDNQNFYGSDKNKLKKAGGTPDSYISAFFSFKLHKGKIKFTKFVKGKAEGLILKWFDLTLDIKISLNSNVFEGSIGEFVVEHFNKISQNYSENKILLLNSDQKKTKPFLHMLFEKKFEDNFEMSQKLRLFLEMNAIQFRFFPLIIKRILSYLVFQTIDENLKEKAYKQVKNLQKLTQV